MNIIKAKQPRVDGGGMFYFKQSLRFARTALEPDNIDLFDDIFDRFETRWENSMKSKLRCHRPVHLGAVISWNPDIVALPVADRADHRLNLGMGKIRDSRKPPRVDAILKFLPSEICFNVEAAYVSDIKLTTLWLNKDHGFKLTVFRRTRGSEYLLVICKRYQKGLRLVGPQEADRRRVPFELLKVFFAKSVKRLVFLMNFGVPDIDACRAVPDFIE